MKNPSPPKHLSREAKSWWRKLQVEYNIEDDHGQLVLAVALEAFDRLKGCQAEIARDGASVVDRFGQRKPHPLLPVERDSRSALLAALKALNLDVVPGDLER